VFIELLLIMLIVMFALWPDNTIAMSVPVDIAALFEKLLLGVWGAGTAPRTFFLVEILAALSPVSPPKEAIGGTLSR